jgi:hypothetical protein
MKNLLLGLALVATVAACSSQKNSVSDATPATGAKAECAGSCEGATKSECCDEKAAGAEAKTCPMTGKVQG